MCHFFRQIVVLALHPGEREAQNEPAHKLFTGSVDCGGNAPPRLRAGLFSVIYSEVMSLRPFVWFLGAWIGLAACPGRSPESPAAVSAQPAPAPGPDVYYGSAACQGCHKEQYESW